MPNNQIEADPEWQKVFEQARRLRVLRKPAWQVQYAPQPEPNPDDIVEVVNVPIPADPENQRIPAYEEYMNMPAKKLKPEDRTVSAVYGAGFRNKVKFTNLTLAKKIKQEYPQLKNEFVGFTPHVGIEIEAEGIREGAGKKPFPEDFWKDDEDTSLKIAGHEYISVPLKGINIEGGLLLLRDWMQDHKINPKFSHRCSVHVHINCLDLTELQVRYVILTYLMFENLLFQNFIDPVRQGNTYCLPIGDFLHDENDFCVRRWFKYAALNIRPLETQGTIEFRHLEGTMDIDKLKKWIRLINHIYKFAQTNSKALIDGYIDSLNTYSGYNQFGEVVFGRDWHLINNGDLLDQMENNIVLCKLLKDKELF